MTITYYNGKYAESKLPDHLKDVKSTLPSSRHEVVKAIANYCIELLRRYKAHPLICVAIVEAGSKSKSLHLTHDRSKSAIFEAVNECFPRNFTKKKFCVSAVEISNYLSIEP